MIPKTKFTGWMLGKVQTFLEKREGCKVHSSGYTEDGSRVTLQDALGFVYQIDIKTVGRIQNTESLDNVLPFKLEKL